MADPPCGEICGGGGCFLLPPALFPLCLRLPMPADLTDLSVCRDRRDLFATPSDDGWGGDPLSVVGQQCSFKARYCQHGRSDDRARGRRPGASVIEESFGPKPAKNVNSAIGTREQNSGQRSGGALKDGCTGTADASAKASRCVVLRVVPKERLLLESARFVPCSHPRPGQLYSAVRSEDAPREPPGTAKATSSGQSEGGVV